MELTIIKKELNPVLSREEIKADIKSDTTPSYVEVMQELAEKLGKDKELIIIKSLYQKYGKHESILSAFVYNNKEAFAKHEAKKEKKKEEKPKEKKAE